MLSDPVVIAAYARTPMGAFQGSLATEKATALGATAVAAVVSRAGTSPERVDQIFMGCVLSAGLGQAPARQVAIVAGLAHSTQATTINKMCGSGMQAAILAHDTLLAGSANIVVAGGMESMSNAPYLLPKHRAGARLGHDVALDHMYIDGLEDAYNPGKLMGLFAEETAEAYQIGRADMDEYARSSLRRAKDAIASGAFDREIVKVNVSDRTGTREIREDEQPHRADERKIPTLKPAFSPNGTVTAANSSSISDGAAALLMTRESVAHKMGLGVVARVISHATYADEPQLFATAPSQATIKVLEKAGWRIEDVDLFEINEAFAVVPMLVERKLSVGRERLNVNGGACALGHPIGASGARIIATLLGALETRGLKRGVASLCLAGGEATAMALELA